MIESPSFGLEFCQSILLTEAMADGEAVEKVHLDVILSAREGSGVVKRLENRDSSLRSE